MNVLDGNITAGAAGFSQRRALRETARCGLLAAACLVFCARAEIKIEGQVPLPPAKGNPLLQARYRNKPADIAPPEAPKAVVYLEAKGNVEAPRGGVEMGQRKYQFVPGLLAVQVGTEIAFPNHDDDYHSVFSYSKPKRFDLGRYRKDEQPARVVFDQPGVVRVNCEIHEHMRGTIVVLESPHFSTTDEAGKFQLRLPDLAPGRYALKAWVQEKDLREVAIDLQPGTNVTVNFPAKPAR